MSPTRYRYERYGGTGVSATSIIYIALYSVMDAFVFYRLGVDFTLPKSVDSKLLVTGEEPSLKRLS